MDTGIVHLINKIGKSNRAVVTKSDITFLNADNTQNMYSSFFIPRKEFSIIIEKLRNKGSYVINIQDYTLKISNQGNYLRFEALTHKRDLVIDKIPLIELEKVDAFHKL